ncbi:aspartate ammonia-lyase, partial [bacterium]|nr:aspartate ammonia-lyase [bacterium]
MYPPELSQPPAWRVEKDFLGEREVPSTAYYGIHTLRAFENFSITARKVPQEVIKAFAIIKKSAAIANGKSGEIAESLVGAMISACDEIVKEKFLEEFILDPLQGGAGTATNMNVNEVIANRANEILGFPLGSYSPIHPLDHANRGQSTNDVFPTAVRIAAIWDLRELIDEVTKLYEALKLKEVEFSAILKIGRTQLQDAVPITLGAEFSAYAEAISRDKWRLFRIEERLRVLNLGGTAIGTSINASRDFQLELINALRDETGIALSRAENLVEATQNADIFSEVSGSL